MSVDAAELTIEAMFSIVTIYDAKNQVHTGKRPSTLLHPFKYVTLRDPTTNQEIRPLTPPEYTGATLGYDVAINVTSDLISGSSNLRWKITSILGDGRQWFTFINQHFLVSGSWIS